MTPKDSLSGFVDLFDNRSAPFYMGVDGPWDEKTVWCMVKLNVYCNLHRCLGATIPELLGHAQHLEAERQRFLTYLKEECPPFQSNLVKRKPYTSWIKNEQILNWKREDEKVNAAERRGAKRTSSSTTLTSSAPKRHKGQQPSSAIRSL